MNSIFRSISLLVVMGLTTSCGTYFRDKDDSSSSSTSTPAPATGGEENEELQSRDLSVNNASATIETDSSGESFVDLEILPGVFPPGSYNGGGTGSKALFGIDNFNGLALSDFQSFEYTSRSSASYAIASILYVNIVLDLKCDGTKLKILGADPEFTSSPTETFADGFETYRITADDQQFRASGGIYYTEGCDNNGDDDCNDVGETPAQEVVSPTNPGVGQLRSFNEILAFYPDACLSGGMTGDGGMPAGVMTSGFMFAIGSSGTNQATNAQVKDIQFNDESYDL